MVKIERSLPGPRSLAEEAQRMNGRYTFCNLKLRFSPKKNHIVGGIRRLNIL